MTKKIVLLIITIELFLILNLTFVKTKKMVNVFNEAFHQEKKILLEKGYSQTEIERIYDYMSIKTREKLLKTDYIDLNDFYKISNFELENIERYKALQSLEDTPISKIITKVNLKLDKPFYSDIETIQNPTNPLVLVNKYRALPNNYIPPDLTSIPSFPNLQIRSLAVEDFEKLLAAAKLDNIFLVPYSAYRSYSYQETLYQKYLENDSQEKVDTYSARQGHSEHQTGLAIDIRSYNHWYNLTEKDYEWMQNNSYKYGFIIRYPENSTEFTGYKEEPWHIRYIGISHATKIHNLKITFDEYYDIYLNEH